ncbi:hypothetical protein PQO03_20000 [Lentisphaera profundi]|jgi:hypothetical protein|uniref:Uncharacterized protein n=1 Tax=Lentisphaera profundi TaxID=1658616 RepID=A0ABY7VV59_9BACT|nr:hypothetical protein [Lentisphaera profundi]WDE98105.1 hypothetical protein PQO03_20000 [Lentisphaera profundi]
MSDNIPRPPRPPRPGASTSAAPAPRSGIRPSGDSANDFGDTRTVILSRKSMSMMQTKKGDESKAPQQPVAPPSMQKANVENGTVYCVSCPASFPIVSDEFYGAVVECPDCAAEFVIPTKGELNSPAPAPVRAAAPAPSQAAPAPVAQKKTPKKRKPVRNVPKYIESEVKDSEEVIFCEIKDLGSGSQAGIVGGVVAMAGGIGGAVIGGGIGIGIAAGVGLVGIILGLILGKKAGGKIAAAITDERIVVKPESGDWVVQSELE